MHSNLSSALVPCYIHTFIAVHFQISLPYIYTVSKCVHLQLLLQKGRLKYTHIQCTLMNKIAGQSAFYENEIKQPVLAVCLL